MPTAQLTKAFQQFVDSEKSGGVLLIICTAISLAVANGPTGADYLAWWQTHVAGLSIEHWINDALMAVFFLLIGLELEREIYSGELSSLRSALLPMFAALGGIVTPALIHYAFNAGTATQPGMGIPMATDIAFALGVLAILGSRIPAALKVFVVAFAVMDDLGAIVVIAFFYTAEISGTYLGAAIGVWIALCVLNRLRVMALTPYLIGGALMWFLMLKSGVHATITGVMLAFAIPYSAKADDEDSPSYRLESILHKPVAFLILPVFALANTAIPIAGDWMATLASSNAIGIIAGLVAGKPLGITLFCFVAVASGLCQMPDGLDWGHILGAGVLGGIGFTMSIFIANLAFTGQADTVNASKIAILAASLAAGILGYLWLRLRPAAA